MLDIIKFEQLIQNNIKDNEDSKVKFTSSKSLKLAQNNKYYKEFYA